MGTTFSNLRRYYFEDGEVVSVSIHEVFKENLIKNCEKWRAEAERKSVPQGRTGPGIIYNHHRGQEADDDDDEDLENERTNQRTSRSSTDSKSRKVNENVDNGNNYDLMKERKASERQMEAKKEDSAKRIQRSDVENSNVVVKPFRPESWPTLEMIDEHLSKLNRNPTTIIFARFAPRNAPRKFVEIQFSTNKATDETVFECSGSLSSLMTSKEGVLVGESKEEQIDYFFKIFKTCLNLLAGQVWWNGYSLVVDQTSTKKRLKLSAFEIEPSQLLFELTNLKDLEVHRTPHKLELRGQIDNSGDVELRTFRIRGPDAKDIKVSKLRGTLITVHVPEFHPSILQF